MQQHTLTDGGGNEPDNCFFPVSCIKMKKKSKTVEEDIRLIGLFCQGYSLSRTCNLFVSDHII